MTDPAQPKPIPIGDLCDQDLALAAATFQAGSMTTINSSLLEALKAGTWLQGVSAASMLAVGLALAPIISDRLALALQVALVGGAAIALGGAAWHRRRMRAALSGHRAMEQVRAALAEELTRRGMTDV